MSVKVMGLAWYMSGLNSTQKIVLLALADHANDEGKHCYPSVERLARKCSLHERTVRRILSEFREGELIKVVGKAKQHRPTEYKINIRMMESLQVRPVIESGLEKGSDLSESPPDLSEDSLRPVTGTGKPSLTIINHPLSEKGFEKLKTYELSQDNEELDLTQFEFEIDDFETPEDYFAFLEEKRDITKKGSPPKNAEEARQRVQSAISTGAQNQSASGDLDLSSWPPDVVEVVQVVCKLWNLKPPRYSEKNGRPCGNWIQSARDLADSCGEFGVEAIREYRKDFEEYMNKHNGLAPFVVNGPFSLVKVVCGKAGSMRGTQLQFGDVKHPPNVTYSEGALKWQTETQ
jgi:hypothetical protein